MNQAGSSNNLLNINLSRTKGLVLDWNFVKNSERDIYYYHLIIIDNQNQKEVNSFLKQYYHKLKPGDMFCVLNSFYKINGKLLKWKQKIFDNYTNYIQEEYLSSFNIEQFLQILQVIEPEIQDVAAQSPLIISIFTSKTCQKQLQVHLSTIKNQITGLGFIINVFGKFHTSISFTTGVNFFQFQLTKSQQIFQFYQNYINKIALYHVRIIIECENGILYCHSNKQWEFSAHNKIQKDFFGPHENYESDALFFVDSQFYGNLNILLNFTLQYQTLQRRKFISRKRISLAYSDNQTQTPIYENNQKNNQITLNQNICLKKYPFRSQLFIWFKENILDDRYSTNSLKNYNS